MKSIFSFSNGKSLILPIAIALIFISCSKGSGTNGPTPNPPTDPPSAKINSFTVSQDNIHYDGTAKSGTVQVNWSTSNGTPTLDGVPVNAVDSKTTPVLFETTTTTLSVGGGVTQTKTITVTIHPVVEQFAGKTGRFYKMVSVTKTPLGGSPQNVMSSCEMNDRYFFSPDGNGYVDLGPSSPSCVMTGVLPCKYTLNVVTSMFQDLSSSGIPAKKATFLTSSSGKKQVKLEWSVGNDKYEEILEEAL